MMSRKKYGQWIAGLTFVAFVAVRSAPVYAYEYPEVPAPPQYGVHSLQKEWGGQAVDLAPTQWAGQSIQEASANWADYASQPNVTNTQSSMGRRIQEASANWADYAGDLAASSAHQPWAGTQIEQASVNWADYRPEPLAASNP